LGGGRRANLLPQWAHPVKQVEEVSQGRERVGTTGVCRVELGGREGTMTELCVEFDPPRRAGYVVETTEDAGDAPIARTDTYYALPAIALFSLMNALIMRRRFTSTVDELLAGLKRSSEVRDQARATT
jgi:hypothetical protein